MSTLKSGFLFTTLVLVISTSVYASEDSNTLRIESTTSISSVVNPATLNLAKSVKAAPKWRNFIPPQAFWSPDGSKLLIRSSIRWYPDDVNFRPSNRNGIDAIYTLDADGTNLTKIVSNEINNRSTPIELPAPLDYNPWNPSGNKIAIYAGFYILVNPDGTGLNALGTNFSDIISIITNLSEISQQRYFAWNPDGTKQAFIIVDIEKTENKYTVKPEKLYIADADGSNIKQPADDVNESFLNAVSWSHDGKRITFSGKNLWIVNSDGTNLRQLGACGGGVWNPDDSKLLCMLSEEVNDSLLRSLYLIDTDSGDKTELTKNIEIENPVWNPDGNSILFKSITERGNHGIYVANLSGRKVKLIHEEGNPVERATIDAVSWSSDGSKIAFTSLVRGIKNPTAF